MKIVHIESGLGNQMLSYCEYLALQEANPDDDCYIETLVYDIEECGNVISQWNGYELSKVFGIDAPNIKQLFTQSEWHEIQDDVAKSQFWNKNWNYPVYFTEIFKRHGVDLLNCRGDFEAEGAPLMTRESDSWRSRFKRTLIGHCIKKTLLRMNQKRRLESASQIEKLYLRTDESIFSGQRLAFKFKGNDIERIYKKIRNAFVFPNITDEANKKMLNLIHSTQSVAIHARRGDMLGYNYECYKFGYFRRAVNYIKKRVENPVFIFFCDPGSIQWCKENEKIFSLDFRKDSVYFVDWNVAEYSYRDLQLMAECKHQIITNSSFGWWATYLNTYPEKITCSPDITINTTNHF